MAAPWQPLLDAWFGDGATAEQVAARQHWLWFGYRPEQDAWVRERFSELMDGARAGRLDHWAAEAPGWLALLLLLDQLPRMICRGTPDAFASDWRAQRLVLDGLARDLDIALTPIQRVFVYLVLEHAENLALQEQALVRFTVLRDIAAPADRAVFEGFLDYARRHREVIARFGRFPHRNGILGRASTEAEAAYLSGPGSRF